MPRLSIAAPHYTDVVKSLEKSDLLPAIVFISSRRGCDEAAESFRGNYIADLPKDRRERIIEEMEHFNTADEDFIRNHRHFHLLMRKGVAAHHAGHLPAWKHIVERLMSRGLLRAVFATTTLAAGIDMPARSVVITASSLRDDEGHRDLKAFELSQMTGRAGRRGKDKVGFSIFIPGPFQDINLILDLLSKEPEPLESQFSANYTMVLNLLLQHDTEDARHLLEKSFGQYQRLKQMIRLRPHQDHLFKELEQDKIGRPCQDRVYTWNRFRQIEQEINRSQKSLKGARRKMKRAALYDEDVGESQDALEAAARAQAARDKIEQYRTDKLDLPCPRCPQLSYCGSVVAMRKDQQREAERIKHALHDLEHGLWERFEECARLLQQFDYLNEEWKPTQDGAWASKLRVENALFIAELVRAEYFATDEPRALAALAGALSAGDREINIDFQEGEEKIFLQFKRAVKIARKISQYQDRAGLFFPIVLDGNAARLLWLWANQEVDWQTLFEQVEADEGDVVRLILRTADLLGQILYLKETHPQLSAMAKRAIELIRRAPIED
jgi:superfamily II RNA helicase